MIQRHLAFIASLLIGSASISTAAVEKPWELSLGGGWTNTQREMPGYAHSQSVLWGSIGYQAHSWMSFGMEGGHFFGKDIPDSSFSFPITNHVSSIYAGPYIQGKLPVRPVTLVGRIGVGAATYSQHVTFEDPAAPLYIDYHSTNVGTTLMLAIELPVLSQFGLRAGMRDIILFQYEPSGGDTLLNPNIDSTLRVRHILMPFGEVTFRF